MNTEELVKFAVDCIIEKKAKNIISLDIRELTTLTDYFIICEADSDTQIKAVAENIEIRLKEEGFPIWHKEGLTNLNWVLLDYVDFVVHIFKPELREFYSLERLWGDAPLVKYEYED